MEADGGGWDDDMELGREVGGRSIILW